MLQHPRNKKSVSAEKTHGDDFSTNEREARLSQHRPKAKEATFCAGDAKDLNKRTGVLPVAEPKTIVVWTSTKVKNDPENDQT
jgi:hypothetical protein